jgi:hypothetical protein
MLHQFQWFVDAVIMLEVEPVVVLVFEHPGHFPVGYVAGRHIKPMMTVEY